MAPRPLRHGLRRQMTRRRPPSQWGVSSRWVRLMSLSVCTLLSTRERDGAPERISRHDQVSEIAKTFLLRLER